MSQDTKFCYHCRTYHVVTEMRRIASKSGTRWRCIRSIEASKSNPDARAAFGRQTSRMNSDSARACALRLTNMESLRRGF